LANGKFLRQIFLGLLVVFLSCTSFAGTKSTTADVVLVHARIYTVNAHQPWAEALAIREGTILAVGTEREIAHYRGPSTKVIDAKGRLILPARSPCSRSTWKMPRP
jgi:hypothetical protein